MNRNARLAWGIVIGLLLALWALGYFHGGLTISLSGMTHGLS